MLTAVVFITEDNTNVHQQVNGITNRDIVYAKEYGSAIAMNE
jgi:hypothetical protein